jgi:lysyl-tRNA synthetase class 2
MNEPNWALTHKRRHIEQRARIIQAIRVFFIAQGYLEVDTPQRIPANAPEPHIDAIASGDHWLQTSPELCMKRLLAAGFDRIFQLCHCWRDDERGARHLPEFTLLEWYRAGIDYRALMTECEELLKALVPAGSFNYQGQTIDLTPPWPRLTVAEAFDRYADLSAAKALASNRFDELLTEQVEPGLGSNPVFLTDYPTQLAALARKSPTNPNVAERFELYIAGIELANAFSELTDPVEQRARFEHDEAQRRAAQKPPCQTPEKFLLALETMPASAGIALGIDRLIMLLTDSATIDQVVPFTPEEL